MKRQRGRPRKSLKTTFNTNKNKKTTTKNYKKSKKRHIDNEGQLYGILDEPNINYVQFGVDKRFRTWYGSNVYFDQRTRHLGFIEENSNNATSNAKEDTRIDMDSKTWLDTLYICEYCFKYTNDEKSLVQHNEICPIKLHSLPGRIKYKSPKYTIRRVKGSKHELFCQCLCLFTKLFLDNKSIYFRVSSYEFFLLYETDSKKPMGFFSKDLVSYQQNNLACILVFPPYQRKQLGTLLIEFSYKLSRLDNLITGPELPLSPFGLIGYLRYWSQVISFELLDGQLSEIDKISLKGLAQATGIRIDDIILTLKHLNCIGENNEIYLNTIREWTKKQKARGKYKLDYTGNLMIDDEYLLIDD